MRPPMYTIVEGRCVEGVETPQTAIDGWLGDYFARAAYKDATSALAFEHLATELREHGAPLSLIDRCEQASIAELTHARELRRLAAELGTMTRVPASRALPTRPLLEIAIDNAVDGLVRGAFGAAVAQLRARTATDARIREVMERIASDERDHVLLAIDLATWLHQKLDLVSVVLVEDSIRQAVTRLAQKLDALPEVGFAPAGVPGRREALRIWSHLSHSLWSGLFEHVSRAAA
jgi:hypothetical protein